MNKSDVLNVIVSTLNETAAVLAARMYGSWYYSESSTDCDIVVMVPSARGVVERGSYTAMREARDALCRQTGQDIDLVPHTLDELEDFRSPLWYPRYNPSLVFGQTIKGKFDISPITDKRNIFSFMDLTVYVLYDNRTICRRQLIRNLGGEAGRIFVSKLIHGAGNVLTMVACERSCPYLACPSDLASSLKKFDEIYQVNSEPILAFLHKSKTGVNFEQGCMLMRWYEGLVALALGAGDTEQYEVGCQSIAAT